MLKLKYSFSGLKKTSVLYALCSVLFCAPALANLPEERLSGSSMAFHSPATFTEPVSEQIRFDTEDPMFFEAAQDFVSWSRVHGGNESIGIMQRFSYGINGNMAFAADISLQNNYRGESGLSDVGLMLMYRTPSARATKTDVFAGINFAGAGAAGLPNHTSTVYVTGARMGRQWARLTIAGTVQASWIFHETEGMAYIDMSPEMYVRIARGWAAGANVMFRKATDPLYDQEWAGGKVTARFGRTVYAGTFDYEFKNDEWRIGGRLNLLF
ncbi:MAG: hypothetical protein FWE64_00595 [Alphaproteobacteria bacterium]|nr:hypothetical protein [Alphaproteobacteria bacterium]